MAGSKGANRGYTDDSWLDGIPDKPLIELAKDHTGYEEIRAVHVIYDDDRPDIRLAEIIFIK